MGNPVLTEVNQRETRMSLDKLKTLLTRCKCGVYVEVNAHRDVYESVETHFEDLEIQAPLRIDPDIRAKMIELNTIVEIQFYPTSPVGFFRVYHYDLEAALDKALQCLAKDQSC